MGHFLLFLVDMLLAIILGRFFLQVHPSPGFAYCQLSGATSYVGARLALGFHWVDVCLCSIGARPAGVEDGFC